MRSSSRPSCAAFELATQNIWNYFVSRTRNFDTFVCCCFICCCCCCWGSGTLHVAVNGPGRCWNERWTHWPWLDCLMLLAKGPILISILINFGTFEKQSLHSTASSLNVQCPRPRPRPHPRLHDHCLVHADWVHDAYFCYVYLAPITPKPELPAVALFVLEILLLRAMYSEYMHM